MSTISTDNPDLLDPVGDHDSLDDTAEIRNVIESSPDSPVFPIASLNTLNNYLNQSKWVVPVLPDSELEILIKATILFAQQGKDEESKHCRRFCRYGLLSSFRKTFLDEAVDGWDCQILHFIYMNALLAIELCAIKAGEDSVPILDLESVLFDPETRFQIHSVYPKQLYWKIQHGERTNGTLRYTHITPLLPHLLAQDPSDQSHNVSQLKEYAHSNPPRRFAPILLDFINLFGRLGGFDKLRERFTRANALDDLPLGLMSAYLYPFSLCCEYLHPDTIADYFIPILDAVIPHILGLTDTNAVSNEKSELKTESLTDLCYYLRSFLLHMPERQAQLEKVEMACLNLILRSLQFPSFSKRMNALNDLNRLFSRLSPSTMTVQPAEIHSHYAPTDPLTIDQVAHWMNDKQVLSLVLRENLHQPQYVEKVEKIIRFMIKHNYLTLSDLDRIWDAQDGKHEAIVKNVFHMLAKLALEFTAEQLDHLFVCFQRSWAHATKRQCEHLIDLICRLAEEDRDGLMAQKVLALLWDLAVDAESSTEISDFALKAHAKILDHNTSDVGMENRMQWLTKLVGFISQGPRHQFLLAAIKQFIDLCNLFPEQQYSQQAPYRVHRRRMKEIKQLNWAHSLCEVVVRNIVESMAIIRQERLQALTGHADQDCSTQHVSLQVEVHALLRLLRYLLIEGSLCLTLDLMQQLWTGMLCPPQFETEELADPRECSTALVTTEDREVCFDWFGQLPPKAIELDNFRTFFDQNIVQVDPANLTSAGMKLFQNFFYQINLSDGLLPTEPLVVESSSQFRYLMDNAQLHGIEHIWRMLLDAPNPVAAQAMEMLQQLYTNLSPRLLARQKELIEDLLQHCFTRLKGDYDTICCLLRTPVDNKSDIPVSKGQITSDVNRTVDRIVRVIQLIHHFVSKEDPDTTATTMTGPDAKFQRIPLKRAWVGSSFFLTVTYYSPMNETRSPTTHLEPGVTTAATATEQTNATNPMTDTVQFPVHTNMTIGELRTQLLSIRLPALRGAIAPESVTPGQPQPNDVLSSDVIDFATGLGPACVPTTTDTSNSAVTADQSQNYKLELYAHPTRETGQQTGPSSSSTVAAAAAAVFPFSGVLVDPLEDDMPVSSLLSLFPEWPSAFLHEPCLDRVPAHDEVTSRLSIVAHVVHIGPQVSYDFRTDGLKGCLRKDSAGQQPPPPPNSISAASTSASDRVQVANIVSADAALLTAGDHKQQQLVGNGTERATGSAGTVIVPYAEGPPNPDELITSESFKSIPPMTVIPADNFEFNSSTQRSQFLLQLAKVAMELNSNQLFASVLDVLLCLPAPETVVERLRLEISTAALVAVAQNAKQVTGDGTVLTEKSAFNGTQLEGLLSVAQLDEHQPSSDQLSRLMELYYTLQVLYCLCLPTAAVNQCHEMFASACGDPRLLLAQDDLRRLPLWYSASQLTVQLLRAGGISLLLSCPLLNPNPRDKERSSTYNTIVKLIRLWLVRLLRLLFTVSAFTLVSLQHRARLIKTNGGSGSDGAAAGGSLGLWNVNARVHEGEDDSGRSVLAERVYFLCDSFRSLVCTNNPIIGGAFFTVRHAERVSRVACSLGVTCSEIERFWLPSSTAGVDNLLFLVFGSTGDDLSVHSFNDPKANRSAVLTEEDDDGTCLTDKQNNNLHQSLGTRHSSGSDRTSRRMWSAVSPKRMENSPDKSFGSGNLSPSSTASKNSDYGVTRSRHRSFLSDEAPGDFQKQIFQSLQSGESTGTVAIEAIACLPLCVALFPHSHLVALLTGTESSLTSVDGNCSVTWFRFVQDLLFSRSDLLRYAGLYGLYQMVTLSSLPTVDSSSTRLAECFLHWTRDSVLHLVQLLFCFLTAQTIQHALQSAEFFRLLALLLRHIHNQSIPFEDATKYLIQEVDWLRSSIAHRQTRDTVSSPNDAVGSPCSPDSVSPSLAHTGSSPTAAAVSNSLPPATSASTEALDTLLCGHMRLCSALLSFKEPQQSASSAANTSNNFSDGHHVAPILAGYTEFEKNCLTPLTKDIVQVLLFPAREQAELHPMLDGGASLSDHLLTGVFELLLALVKRDPSAVHLLSSLLCRSCFPDDFDLSTYSWHYSPPVIKNTTMGLSRFVGLRNGGATCYMNSILQQLFSLIPIRNAVLRARPEQRLQEEQRSTEISNTTQAPASSTAATTGSDASVAPTSALVVDTAEVSSCVSTESSQSTQLNLEQKDVQVKPLSAEQTHHLKVLLHTQSIFGHLTHSLLQSYKPTEFWQEFRFCSEQLNIREQHDAVEFMQTVANDLDEALHLCGMPKAVEQVLGGTFADQKLCIDCPHRYSRNESFTILSVDIRNHTNLLQSLEQYVKGDRLEGDNAYWCEACNAKVTTLKRMCIDRLPLVLAIQLKRFDYDWDRGMAIKFNDYFEFPRELDMYPYTVQGLSHQFPDSNSANAADDDSAADPMGRAPTNADPSPGTTTADQPHSSRTRYTLRGVVVHSGQAGGGHYYSFIRHYCPKSKTYRWYKYDDTEVSPSPMDNEHEARAQWFGGDAANDPYDVSKLTYSWTSKRWWCAYILFYEREDFQSELGKLLASGDQASPVTTTTSDLCVTPRVKKVVHRENVEYLHQRMQFHPLLSDFVANMTGVSLDMCARIPGVTEDLALTSMRLLINFCFAVRFQNVARDWQRWIPLFFRLVATTPLVRQKFVQWAFFSSPDRAAELLFECPYAEVRFLFGSLILYIMRIDALDPCQSGGSCLRMLQQLCDQHASEPQKPSSDAGLDQQAAQTARAESAAQLLRSIICTKSSESDSGATACIQPNVADCLLQLILLQLRFSPAECLRHIATSGAGTSTQSDPKVPSTGSDLFYETGQSFSGKITPGTSYSKSNSRYAHHHPLVWSQYFSIFLDYASTDELARKRLLRLGTPEIILSYAMNNQSAFSSSTSSFGMSWLGSANPPASTTPRTVESVKQSLDQIVHTVWDVCMQAGQPIAPTVEDTYSRLSSSLNSVILALTANTGNASSYSNLYTTGAGSTMAGSPSAMTVQYAGVVKLWNLLSLLVRSLDVTPLLLSHPAPDSGADPSANAVSTHTGSSAVLVGQDSHPMADTSPLRPNSAPTSATSPASSNLDGASAAVVTVAETGSVRQNPYASSSVPLHTISPSLALCLVPNSATRLVSHALRPWLNASTLESFTNILMFLCYKNVTFSTVVLDGLVWSIKNCQFDTSLTLALLQSILSVADQYKCDRLRYSLVAADRTGLTDPHPSAQYHQSVAQYTKVVKLFMELVVRDPEVQRFFQSDEHLVRWLRRWMMAIEHSMQPSSTMSQTYWYMSANRSSQSQDAFMQLAQQVYRILPMTDDLDQGPSSAESEGLEEDEGDPYQSDGSHFEDPTEQETDGHTSDPCALYSSSLDMVPDQRPHMFLRTPPADPAPMSELGQSGGPQLTLGTRDSGTAIEVQQQHPVEEVVDVNLDRSFVRLRRSSLSSSSPPPL